jgi:hypothetical protein
MCWASCNTHDGDVGRGCGLRGQLGRRCSRPRRRLLRCLLLGFVGRFLFVAASRTLCTQKRNDGTQTRVYTRTYQHEHFGGDLITAREGERPAGQRGTLRLPYKIGSSDQAISGTATGVCRNMCSYGGRQTHLVCRPPLQQLGRRHSCDCPGRSLLLLLLLLGCLGGLQSRITIMMKAGL